MIECIKCGKEFGYCSPSAYPDIDVSGLTDVCFSCANDDLLHMQMISMCEGAYYALAEAMKLGLYTEELQERVDRQIEKQIRLDYEYREDKNR